MIILFQLNIIGLIQKFLKEVQFFTFDKKLQKYKRLYSNDGKRFLNFIKINKKEH